MLWLLWFIGAGLISKPAGADFGMWEEVEGSPKRGVAGVRVTSPRATAKSEVGRGSHWALGQHFSVPAMCPALF